MRVGETLSFILVFVLLIGFASASSGFVVRTGVFFILEGLSYDYLGQNVSSMLPGESVELYSRWISSSTLGWAFLSTNETGDWKNYTNGTYGSPVNLTGYNDWSNFTWSNNSIQIGNISWVVYANDTYNRTTVTNTTTFEISTTSTTTTSTTTTSPGGGGGGATETSVGVEHEERNFTLSSDLLKVDVKQGDTAVEYLEIRNLGKGDIELEVLKTGFDNELLIESEKINIPERGVERFKIVFSPIGNKEPGLYMGKIYFKGYGMTKSVDLIMEVQDKSPLFDISVKIPEVFKEVDPGNDLFTSIELNNMGEEEKLDVTLYYSIIDTNNNVVNQKQETFAVEKTKTLNREINIPENSKPGKYLLYARVEYEDKVATSSEFFQVRGDEQDPVLFKLSILVILLLTLLVIMKIVAEVDLRIKRRSEVKWSPKKRTNWDNARRILKRFPRRMLLGYKRIKKNHHYFTKVVTKKKRKNKKRN